MAERGGRRRDESGTSGGTDVEPLRGGMREEEEGRAGPEHARDRPAAPDHAPSVPEGGLAPRDTAGDVPPQRAPDASEGDADRRAGAKLPEERRDHENEAGNAPRGDPGARGAGET